jgi:hypothetical protein
VAALLLLEVGDWRRTWQAAGAFVVTYFLIAAVYMGDARLAVVLIHFQAQFFAHPNASASYGTVAEALRTHPAVPVALFFVLVALRATARHATIAAWCALYLVLLERRPHDSSLTSFGLSLGFMLALLYRWQILACIALALFAVDRGATMQTWLRMPSYYVAQEVRVAEFERFFPPADKVTWYLPPDSPNSWNAGFAVQGFGYNGGMALRDGEPRAFHRLYPGTYISHRIPADGAVYWTRPPGSQPPLPDAEETRSLDGYWTFGKARRHGGDELVDRAGAVDRREGRSVP